MLISRRDVSLFLKPWPILLPKGQYRLSMVSIKYAKKLMAYWPDSDGKRKPILIISRKIKRSDYLGKRHQIESIIEHGSFDKPAIILNKNSVIIDGNHRMCAMIQGGYRGPVLVFKHIAPKSKKRRE